MFSYFRKYFQKNGLLKNTLIKSIILLSIALVIAIALGITLSRLNNMEDIDNLLESKRPSMPSVLLDRNDKVITEYYSDEKRDLITLDQVPDYLIKGLILWEDESFFHHRGFNLWAIFRAFLNNVLGRPVSGASTLTQQLSRTLFLSNKFSWTRKIKELWYAIQLEKKYTKNEILSLYLNHIPLGYGTNGIQTASRFYFNKEASELSPAEAASIITIISNPTAYSLIRFPKNHKTKQKEVLRRMVKAGIINEMESESSFNKFWIDWQTTAHTARGAFYNREDKAPFFSDWVLNELNKALPNVDVFRDGLTIHSTLDLNWNKLAEDLFNAILKKQQTIFEESQLRAYEIIQNYYIDTIGLLSDTFSLTNITIDRNKDKNHTITEYSKDINPALNLTAQVFGLNLVDNYTEIMFDKEQGANELLPQVQGAFISFDNETGQIITMYGGKKFDPNNRFNFAMQSRRQPGSSFKPLIYSYAFDTKLVTAGTPIMDKPHVFTFDSDDPDDWYIPSNYAGRYYGKINLREALRKSLNIPACKVFYLVGYDNKYKYPLDRAALLLGINSQEEIEKRFKPEISTVLGTASVSPIEMATAFSTFANLGKRRIPNSILYVEDRDGRIIYEPWKELQKYYRENDKKLQLISPQNAYLITSILKQTISSPDGTLAWIRPSFINQGKTIPPVEIAAKTGTTQNWSDAWVIGYSPYITAAGWVGFDKYGLSLGFAQPADTVVGPSWMEFMRQYHENYDKAEFKIPDRIYAVKVCRESGLKPSKYCNENSLYYEYFLPGTIPTKECDYCEQNLVNTKQNMDSFSDFFDKNYDRTSINKLFGDDNIEVDRSILDKYKSQDNDLKLDHEIDKTILFDFEDKKITKESDIINTELAQKNKDNSVDANTPPVQDNSVEALLNSMEKKQPINKPVNPEMNENNKPETEVKQENQSTVSDGTTD